MRVLHVTKKLPIYMYFYTRPVVRSIKHFFYRFSSLFSITFNYVLCGRLRAFTMCGSII